MFSYLTRLVGQFYSKPIRSILLLALAVLILAVLLTSFLRWLRRRREDRPDSWVGLITASLSNVLKVLAGLGVLAGLCLHLRFRAEEFARLRGGVSQKNYEAVKTIWGRPHVQRELRAHLARYTKKYFNVEGLEFDPEKLKAASQPIAYRAVDIEEVMPGNPVIEADHEIDLHMNYRRKGNASYPGFEVDCRFTYLIRNHTGKEVVANLYFPFPVRQGLVDKLVVTLDGNRITDWMAIADDTATWRMPMAKDQETALVISYHSRGLDHIRLEPAGGRVLRKYRVRMNCRGVNEADINYPIGCMTPTRKKAMAGGTLLEWDLEHAVTRLGMGVILPKEKQAGYYVAKVLRAAPLALVLLLTMVLATHLATGRGVRFVLLILLGVSFHLYYLLMGHVADYRPGLIGGMIVAGAVMTALTALLQFKRADWFTAAATTVFFVIFCVAWPLTVISAHAGLIQTVLYVALVGYVTILLIRQRRPAAPEPPAPPA